MGSSGHREKLCTDYPVWKAESLECKLHPFGVLCGFPSGVHCITFLEVTKSQSELQHVFGFLGHAFYLKCGRSGGGRWNSPEMA